MIKNILCEMIREDEKNAEAKNITKSLKENEFVFVYLFKLICGWLNQRE
jgi:hypothetical protein